MHNRVSGLWGKEKDSNNNPISIVTITIHIGGSLLEVMDKKAMFMTIYS